MNELPQSPFSVLDQVAIGYHEVFVAYVTAGFSEPQAMSLVGVTINANILARAMLDHG